MSGAIVNEWVEPVGGAEQVLDALAAEFPDARILCPWNDAPDRYGPPRIIESWMARTPLRRHKALAMPFMLANWRHRAALDVEWLLCASHLFAHQVRLRGPARDVPKFVYAHSPARYIWQPELDGRGNTLLARAIARPVRAIDRRRAQEPAKIAAVSAFIAARIERCWDRESTVIHPPVDVSAFMTDADELSQEEQQQLASLPKGFVLGASRFVPYKRVDVAIAAGLAADVPVVLAGDGPDRDRLLTIADEHPGRVTFVRRPSQAMLRALYRRALAFVFAPVEDFGIMPVEAMATGTPVVANAIGGASETVVDGVTGSHIHSTDVGELRRAIEVAAAADPAACRERALEFDGSTFGPRVRDWMGL
ncbi:MAG: glycosyltransferase family 4 protein [Microbacteriaceae bacterium]|nr:MAG: glycosyltransferase family 4 protein [Microbacteriaceae bacterium]